MSKWQIKLIDIGRGKVCRTIETKGTNLPMVEHKALRECKKHLASRGVMLFSNGDLTYDLSAGGRHVGNVEISTA